MLYSFSNCWVSLAVCGSQEAEAYSKCGLTKEMKAKSLDFGGEKN